MAIWRLIDTNIDNPAMSQSVDLDDSFNLQSYNRRTSFNEMVLEGEDGVLIDAQSRREEPRDIVLQGLIQEATPAATEAKLLEIEAVLASDSDHKVDLIHVPNTLANIRPNKWEVQHVETVAHRIGGNVLSVTITLRTNIEIIRNG